MRTKDSTPTDRFQPEMQEQATAPGKPIDMAALGCKRVADYYHAQSERFLVFSDARRWQPFSGANYRRILRSRGLKAKPDEGEALSEIDMELVRVQTGNDVTRYGPLCGHNSGFFEEDGTRFLVTEDMQLVEPVEGTHATVGAILFGLLHDGESPEIGQAQVHTFTGWLKSSVEALRSGRHQQQQALALCGPRDCGKSFVQHHIITPCLGGRSADAERAFLRGNSFNADLFAAEHLTLDDCHASTSIRDRVAFGAMIKTHTVGASVKSYHAKGKDAFNIRPWWRISITLNDGPEAMHVLPPLNDDVNDKICILRASQFDFPAPITTTAEKEAFARKVRAEIPAFLWWLLNEYRLPDAYADPRRYNVATYHHPTLLQELEALTPERELLELIDLAFQEDLRQGPIRLTAAKIEERIAIVQARRAERLFHFPNSCGTYLGRLAMKHPERVQKSDTATERGWLLLPPEK
jgi:hypothetical protein